MGIRINALRFTVFRLLSKNEWCVIILKTRLHIKGIQQGMMISKLWNNFTAAPHRVMIFGGTLQALAVVCPFLQC
jgi:hypothetical protein